MASAELPQAVTPIWSGGATASKRAKAADRYRRGRTMAIYLREGRLLNQELELLDAAGRRAYLKEIASILRRSKRAKR
jgi:hypothetical protein